MYLSIFDSGEKVRAEALSIDPASLYVRLNKSPMGARTKANAIRYRYC